MNESTLKGFELCLGFCFLHSLSQPANIGLIIPVGVLLISGVKFCFSIAS